MSMRLLNDYVAYEQVESYPITGALLLIVDPTVKKIVTYVADGITDISIGDEIITGRGHTFSWEHGDKTIFFIRRQEVQAVIPKSESEDASRG